MVLDHKYEPKTVVREIEIRIAERGRTYDFLSLGGHYNTLITRPLHGLKLYVPNFFTQVS